MIEKMTSNVTQIVLAGAAAVAVAFPTPQDAKDAFLDVIRPDRVIQIETTADEAIPTNPDTSLAAVVSFDPAAECLHSAPDMPREALTTCIDQLYVQIKQDERLPSLIASPTFPMHGPQFQNLTETQRLALSEFCRALWTANSGQDDAIRSPGCSAVVRGVERPA